MQNFAACTVRYAREFFAKAFHSIGLTEDLAFIHFDGCEEIAFHPKPSARFDLPRGYYLTKVYDDVKAARAAPLQTRTVHVAVLSKEDYENENYLKINMRFLTMI